MTRDSSSGKYLNIVLNNFHIKYLWILLKENP
jgi:hypothetical protein